MLIVVIQVDLLGLMTLVHDGIEGLFGNNEGSVTQTERSSHHPNRTAVKARWQFCVTLQPEFSVYLNLMHRKRRIA